jgi:hypothetical protein
MGWETRHGRGHYYTRSIREGDTVHREYLGSGDLGQYLAAMDDAERIEQELAAETWRQERDAALEREQGLVQFDTACDVLLEATLTAAGYRRHNYGKWRKRRGS